MFYTQKGYQELVDELHYLKHEKREKIKNEPKVFDNLVVDKDKEIQYGAAKDNAR